MPVCSVLLLEAMLSHPVKRHSRPLSLIVPRPSSPRRCKRTQEIRTVCILSIKHRTIPNNPSHSLARARTILSKDIPGPGRNHKQRVSLEQEAGIRIGMHRTTVNISRVSLSCLDHDKPHEFICLINGWLPLGAALPDEVEHCCSGAVWLLFACCFLVVSVVSLFLC